tara:strand:+ start:1392 stop:1835 length:444 start_codon:yes stop_codon:yes gene_type:complete
MPDAKTFYPGSSASNPINNSTDSVNATTATTATTATNVDDVNATPNITLYSGTEASAPFRFTNGATSAPSGATSLTITSADILANSFTNGDTVYVSDSSNTNVEKQGTVASEGAGTVTITMDAAFTSSDTTNYIVGKRTPNQLYITY